jgi:gliding motility-associated-like protein
MYPKTIAAIAFMLFALHIHVNVRAEINTVIPGNPGITVSSVPNDVACELTLHMVPPDMTISCEEANNLTDPVIGDHNPDCCDPVSLTLSVDTIQGICPVIFVLRRTWTLSDECGHSAQATQLLTVVDHTPPVFIQFPANVTVSCDAIPSPPTIGVDVVATDDCEEDVVITFSSAQTPSTICPQQYVIVRTWVARDGCDNSSFVQQLITVRDLTPPVFVDPPQDITIACGAPPPSIPDVKAVDNCSQQLFFTFNESLSGWNYCDIVTRQRTWTVEDECGNRSTHIQTIRQLDAGAPIFSGIPVDTTVECGEIPNDEPSVSDDCDDDVAVVYSEQRIEKDCPGNFTLIRTWTASDHCGYTAVASQTIEVQDTRGPEITFIHPLLTGLANGDTLKMPCEATEIFGLDDAIITDACDPSPEGIFIDSLIFEDDCKKLLYCEWRAEDFCGNVTSFIFYMLVGDFIPPTISNVPADISITCQNTIPPSPTPNVEDDCDLGPKINLTETIDPGPCPHSYTLIRTWIAHDFCGNTSSATQRITVVDNQAPVISPIHPILAGQPNGAIVVVECGQEPVLTASSVSATDNCDPNPPVTLATEVTASDCLTSGYFREVRYRWTAMDACGNQHISTVFIRVQDTTPPLFTQTPQDMTINCDAVIPNTPPTAEDECGGPVAILPSDITVALACGYRIDRTWTATDQCGNSTSVLQRISVTDTEPPVLAPPPADLTLMCDEPLPAPPQLGAVDNCDPNPQVALEVTTIAGNCPGNYELIRTWTASDACGNSATISQRISVHDTVAPVFTAIPPDATIACDEVPSGTEGVTATDNCSPNVLITVKNDATPGNCPGNYLLVRTFTLDDGCGNTRDSSQTLLVVDDTPPVFDPAPANITVECGYTDYIQPPSVADNCDPNVHITREDEIIAEGTCIGEYLLIITWTATDHCGNTSSASQQVQVVDTTPPVITPNHPTILGVPNGGEIFMECDALVVMDTTDVAVFDVCDPDPEVTFAESIVFGDCSVDGYLYILTSTWTSTDDCGNTSSYTIFVKVVDTKAPIILNPPADITVHLKSGEQIPPIPTLEAEDNCDQQVTLVFEEAKEEIECGFVLTRTWIAIDQCGNSAQHIQRIMADEGCPCEKPQITGIDIKHPKFGLPSGSVTLHLSKDPSLYNYTWLPALGSPGSIGHVRTNLPAGEYQVFIQDPAGGASCFTKINIVLTDVWTCIDSVYLTIPMNDPFTACIDSVIDIAAPLTDVFLCGIDSSSISSVTFDLPTPCLTFQPVKGFTGDTELCIIHCNDASPAQCDTTYLFIKVLALKPCDDIFTDALIPVSAEACDLAAAICLPVPLDVLKEYSLTISGQPYTQALEGCGYQTTRFYALEALPGGGPSGEYSVDSWIINGQNLSGLFNNIPGLIIWMNQADPGGNWIWEQGTNRIIGGKEGNNYGPLVIRQSGTNQMITLGLQAISIPQGSQIYLPEGEYQLVIQHNFSTCSDDIFISVTCEEVHEYLIAVNDTVITGQQQGIVINILDNDIIPNNYIADFHILHQPSTGTLHILPDLQVLYTPGQAFCGNDQFSYIICNEVNCDTATVYISVSCKELVIHNGFSPNGDGVNDTFIIEGIDQYPNNEIVIFNRWGNEVFRKKRYNNEWNGTWSNGIVPDGTYYYVLEDGEGGRYAGWVQIAR